MDRPQRVILEDKVLKKLKELGRIRDLQVVVIAPFGTGYRVTALSERSGGERNANERSCTFEALSGTLKDQVNGIVGRLLNPEPVGGPGQNIFSAAAASQSTSS